MALNDHPVSRRLKTQPLTSRQPTNPPVPVRLPQLPLWRLIRTTIINTNKKTICFYDKELIMNFIATVNAPAHGISL